MNQFKKLLGNRLEESSRLNRIITRIAGEVRGQSSPKIMAALNAMVAATDGACLEIGIMYGRTLCGAIAGNEGRTFIGVDSALTDAPEANVRKLYPDADFHFYRMDFRRFFRNHAANWRGRISAYFYDADHSLAGQRDGLRLAVESGVMANEAFIAVDDYSWLDTKKALREFLTIHPGWEVVLAEEDDWNRRGWWNGLVVLYRGGRDE